MENEESYRNPLIISQEIGYKDVVKRAAIIFYNPAEKDQVFDIVGRKVDLKKDAIQIIKQEQQYWIIRECVGQTRTDIDQIQRLVGLTFTIICIQIANHLQAIVEKAFSLVLTFPQLEKHQIKLFFIKSIYINKLNSIEIKYCEDAFQANTIIRDDSIKKTIPIKMFDLLQIFDCELSENVAKIRQVYQRFEIIKAKQDEFEKINRMIFQGGKQKGFILKQLSKLSMQKQRENKLIWKLDRLNNYKLWLEEQKEYTGVNCSSLTFKELDSKINHISIAKYKKAWTANSLLCLKKYFNKISSKRDTNSIKQFCSEYQLMRDNLLSLQKEIADLPYSFALTLMREELESFYLYHKAIIEGQTYGFFSYLKNELKYLWRYNNRIYKKITAFVILAAFAYAQRNFIQAMTIILIALIVLALRC